MTIVLRNWDHGGQYRFGIGMGFYFDGKRRVVRQGETVVIPASPDKRLKVFEDTLGHLVSTVRQSHGVQAPVVIIDDHSPVLPNLEALIKIAEPNPFLYFRLPKNLGCGGKENILQSVLSARCDYVARCDDDVTLDTFNFDDFTTGFDELEDAFAITSCITYFARLDAANLPEQQRWFSGSNIADFVVYRSSVFDKVGYSDPVLRSNDDGEIRLRIDAALGMKVYVDKFLTGKALPSGAGAGLDKRIQLSQYVEATRPFIKVVRPKASTPRYRLNKKMAHEAQGFYVPPHPYAEMLMSHIWK